MRMRRGCVAAVVVLGGCATNFTGSAYIQGGATQCAQMCARSNLQMAGMVYSGEFSSSCVCAVPHGPMSTQTVVGTAASTVPQAVGVAINTRNAESH